MAAWQPRNAADPGRLRSMHSQQHTQAMMQWQSEVKDDRDDDECEIDARSRRLREQREQKRIAAHRLDCLRQLHHEKQGQKALRHLAYDDLPAEVISHILSFVVLENAPHVTLTGASTLRVTTLWSSNASPKDLMASTRMKTHGATPLRF